MKTHKYERPVINMIRIKGNEVSEKYAEIVGQSWKNAKYDLIYQDATTPENYPEKTKLEFGLKTSGREVREFTETEKAVWHSHYTAWSTASRKSNPMVIIEHDSLLLKPIDHTFKLLEYYDILGISHCGVLSARPDKQWGRLSAGSGYILTPKVAKLMVERLPKRITFNSDAYIHNYINQYGAFFPQHVTQFYIPSLGTTIKH